MRRLFWKEWRERGLWFLLWTLAVVVLAALGEGQQTCSWQGYFSQWVMLPIALALLAGLLGYSSELVGGRATFLYSRAQLWKSLLFVKIVTGVLVALGAVTLGALACRLTAPAAYLPLMTPAHLAGGALWMALMTSIAYLLGLCCSIVLPGLAGSVIALLLWMGMLMMVEYTHRTFAWELDPGLAIIGTMCAPVIALVVLARFGLTLSWQQRIGRFILMMGVVIISGFVLILLPITQRVTHRFFPPRKVSEITVSPSGRAAIIRKSQYQWVRLDTGQRASFPNTLGDCMWVTDDILLVSSFNLPRSSLACWDRGQVRITPLANYYSTFDNPWNGRYLYSSPDGTRVLEADSAQLSVVNPHTGTTQVLFSIAEERLSSLKQKSRLSRRCWWQDNHTVGYYDPLTNRRTLVKVE